MWLPWEEGKRDPAETPSLSSRSGGESLFGLLATVHYQESQGKSLKEKKKKN